MPNKFKLQHMKSSLYRAVKLSMAVLLSAALIITGVNLSVPVFGASDTQQSDSVAKVEANDGTTKYYSNFVEAWNAAQEYDSAKLSVLDQIWVHKDRNNTVTLSKGNVELYLGTPTTAKDSRLFLYSVGGVIPITINGGTLTIAGGSGHASGSTCIKVNRGGTLNIAGGELIMEGRNSLLIKSEGTVNVTGGQVKAQVNATMSTTSGTVISSSGTLNISGDGTIFAPNDATTCVSTSGGRVNMTGGSITGGYVLIDRWGGTVNISGGKLSHSSVGGSQSCTIKLARDAMKDILAEGKAFKLGDSYISADDLEKTTYTIPYDSSLTVADATCRITGQPSGAEYTYGDKNPAALSVSAEVIGTGTLSYEWHRSDTTEIVSRSASCPVDMSKTGTFQYYCVVSCGGYSVNSDKVTVNVRNCLHESLDSNHVCTHCQTKIVAMAEISGSTGYYPSVTSAAAAAGGGSAKISLLDNVTESVNITSGTIAFSGGNYTLTAPSGAKAINVTGGDLTIESSSISGGISMSNGSCTVKGGTLSGGLSVNGGTCIIEDGTINDSVSVAGGSCTVKGGTLNGGLSVNNGSCTVEGGTINNGVSVSNGTLANIVNEGYTFKSDGSWVTDLTQNSLTGTVAAHRIPIKITKQPVGSTSYKYNEEVTLSVAVEAYSDSPVSYQWYRNNGIIGGATSAEYTYTENNTMNHSFKCVVTCDGYSIDSDSVYCRAQNCRHMAAPQNKKCSICGGDLDGSVTFDDTTYGFTYYTFDEAFEYVKGKKAVMTLWDSVIIDRPISIGSGTNITLTSQSYAVSCRQKNSLTIEEGGTLIFNNIIMPNKDKSKTAIFVNGGTFIMDAPERSWIDNPNIYSDDDNPAPALVVNSGTVILRSGKFRGTITTNNGTLIDLLESGKGIKMEDGSWADPTASSLTGEFTIEDYPLKITTQPEDTEITKRESTTLSVAAECADSGDITYQWYKVNNGNAEEIADATSSTYTTEGLDTGEYSFYCVVRCDAYITKSRTANVTVKENDYTFAAQPGKEAYDYGGSVEITASVTGADAGLVKEAYLYCGETSLSSTSFTDGTGSLSAQVSDLVVNDLQSELTVKFYTADPSVCVGEVSVTVTLNPCQHMGSGQPATCIKKASCDDCGQEYGEYGDHDYGSELKHDETNHWQECGVCSEKKDVTAHDFGEGVVTTEPTCKDTGIRTFTCKCGETKTETVPATDDHTWDEGKVTKEATCTEAGEKTVSCSVCGKTNTEVIPLAEHSYGVAYDETNHWQECRACGDKKDAAAHDFGEGAVTTEPTCKDTGIRTFTCECGETKTETVPATDDHTWDEGTTTKAATCTEEGEKTVSCGVCGKTQTEVIPIAEHSYGVAYDETNHWQECRACGDKKDAAAHDFGESAVTTEPTCKDTGIRTFTCECGETKTETVPVTDDHTWDEGKVTKAATCIEAGEKTYSCTVCGKTNTEAISAIGHDYRPEVTTEPTVDNEGVRTYSCANCGDSYTESIPKLPAPDHEHNYTPAVTKAAACTENGVKTYSCSCGDSYTETILSTGHDYRSEITTEPTVDNEGMRTYTCANCGDSYTESVAKLPTPDHEHNYTPAVTKAAACTENGVKTYSCSCGDSYTKTIPATDHDYRSEITTEPTVDNEGVRTYTCANCGDSYTESIAKLPKPDHQHSYTMTVTKAAACTENGVKTYTCDCGDSYTETIPSTGHDYRSEITTEPTVDNEGVRTYSCNNCGDSYTESIPKLDRPAPSTPSTPSRPSPSTPGRPVHRPYQTTEPEPSDTPKPDDTSEKPGETSAPGENTEITPEPAKPEAGKPYIKDENGKEGWDVIRAEADITNDGGEITVEMNGTPEVPGDILNSIKGEDITMTFDMVDGVSWSVNGTDITSQVGNIDFGVTVGTSNIPSDVIDNVAGENHHVELSLAYEGEFGFTAVLSVELGAENAGCYASLFYYNEQSGEPEFISECKITEDGVANLEFTHASEYIVVVNEKSMFAGDDPVESSETSDVSDTSEISETSETSDTSGTESSFEGSTDSSESEPTSDNSDNSGDSSPASGESDHVDENPNTGVTLPFVVVLIAAASIVTSYVVSRKNKDRR